MTDAGGELIVLDSSDKYGGLVIDRSISVTAPGDVSTSIPVLPGRHGIVINAPNIKVVLHGLTVQGFGGDDGIRIENAANVIIEEVTITDVGNDNFWDAGISVSAAGSRVFINDTTVRGTKGYGINIQAASTGTLDVSVTRSTLVGNVFYGISTGQGGVRSVYRVAITDSVLSHNGGGISMLPTGGEKVTALVGDNRVANHNAEGIFCGRDGVTSTVTLVAERNEVVANGSGFVQDNKCTFKSMGNNTVETNTTDIVGVITPAALR